MRRAALVLLLLPVVAAACGGGSGPRPAANTPPQVRSAKPDPEKSRRLENRLRSAKGGSRVHRVVVAGDAAFVRTDLRPTADDRVTARALCQAAVLSPDADSAQIFGVNRNVLETC